MHVFILSLKSKVYCVFRHTLAQTPWPQVPIAPMTVQALSPRETSGDQEQHMYSFTHSSVHSPRHSLTQSFIQILIHSFLHSTHLFNQSLIHSVTSIPLVTYHSLTKPFIYWLTNPFIQSFTHLVIRSLELSTSIYTTYKKWGKGLEWGTLWIRQKQPLLPQADIQGRRYGRMVTPLWQSPSVPHPVPTRTQWLAVRLGHPIWGIENVDI